MYRHTGMNGVDVTSYLNVTSPSMSEKKLAPTAIRLDASQLDEAEALAKKMSRPGLTLTRTDVLRMAVVAGLKEIRRDQQRGIGAPSH